MLSPCSPHVIKKVTNKYKKMSSSLHQTENNFSSFNLDNAYTQMQTTASERIRHRVYDDETRAVKRERRALHSAQPLFKLVRNATARAKTAWHQGLYGEMTEERRKGSVPRPGNRCTYDALSGEAMNGYEIRLIRTDWCTLMAVWSFEGVVCVPLQFVQEGHRPGVLDPSPPLTCLQCDEVSYAMHRCSSCGAPMYHPPAPETQ